MNPPQIAIRSFSDDSYFLDKVFYSNSYRIKGFKDKDKAPIVVDIGAGPGFFAFTVLALGAKKVYSIEPFIENYKMLLKNTGDIPLVVQHQLAISNDNNSLRLAYPTQDKSQLFFSRIEPIEAKFTYFCPSVTLDNLLTTCILDE